MVSEPGIAPGAARLLCLVTRAVTAAQARLPSSAPPPRRHHRRPCSSLVRAAGGWVVRVGGVGARVDPAYPLRGRTRASLLVYPGWAPPRYPPRRGARSIGGGEEGSSRATSRGPRPGPREPRKSEAAARASGGAAGAGASARGRRAAFMSSMLPQRLACHAAASRAGDVPVAAPLAFAQCEAVMRASGGAGGAGAGLCGRHT